MAGTNYSRDIPQHSLIQSAFLSIIPGVLVTGAFIILKAPLESSGYPPLLAFLLAILLVDVPVMLGIMYYEGKKLNGRYSLDGIVLYREKVSWKTFILLFIAAFVVVFLLIMLAAPITDILTQAVFSGLPNWFFLEERSQYESYSKNALILVFVIQLILTGIILPWVEELYFRGYLLPRISRFRAWAPLMSGFFFGLYHIWQLFGFVTVFLLGTALGYIVWWKRDIRLSISLHIFANAIVRLMFLMVAVAK